MKYLGIDFGTKNVGIAISDDNGSIAFPDETLPSDKNLLDKVIKLCEEKSIEAIVIGESNDFFGAPNPIMVSVKKFIETLKKSIKLPIILEPEFMTSIQAERLQGKVAGLDSSAAAIILQSYLDKMKNVNIKMQNDNPSEPVFIRANVKIENDIDKKKQEKSENKIPYDDFAKVEIKVGKILTAEKILTADKLLKLNVDFGEGKTRQIVSGIALHFPDPGVLVEKQCLFVTNLEPRVIRGEESNGMILALSTESGGFSLLEPNSVIPIGTKVK